MGEPLKDGDQIKHVDYDTAPADLMNDLKGISKNIIDITDSLKNVLGGEQGQKRLANILESFEKVSLDIRSTIGRNSGKFDRVVDNVVEVTKGAKQFTRNFRTSARAILGDVQTIVATCAISSVTTKRTFKVGSMALGAVGRSSAHSITGGALDYQSIAQKIDTGDGNPASTTALARNMNTLMEESGTFVKQITRLHRRRTEYVYTNQGQFETP